MHELVWRYWRSEGAASALAPLPADAGAAILACFAPRGGPHPVWVAKIARTAAGRGRLRREWQALLWLFPWHGQFRLPAVLDWSEDDAQACLVQSGLDGQIPRRSCSRRGFGRRGRRLLQDAVEWILRLQRLVPPPRKATVQQLGQEWLQRHASQMAGQVPPGLLATIDAAIAQTTALAAVAVHGDFWYGNLLVDGRQIAVTDWCGFDVGSPLDDFLSLLIKYPACRSDRAALFRALFFDRCRLAQEAEALAAAFIPASARRLCFYLSLARRLWWEAGFSYQARNEAEREASRVEWAPSLLWLEQQGFPTPWG